jgi:hypothetical protein
MNPEEQMSVDTEAEASAKCVEKHVVLAWTSDGGPDKATVSITAEKPAPNVEKPEPPAMVQSAAPDQIAAGPNQIKAEVAPGKPPSRVEQREAQMALPVSLPESLTFHCVQPYELDSLGHLVRPVSLAVASATTGCALGMIPLVHGALDAVGDLSKVSNDAMLWYLIYAMIFALCSGISIIAWINVVRGRTDARKLLQQIRRRPKIPLSQVSNQ